MAQDFGEWFDSMIFKLVLGNYMIVVSLKGRLLSEIHIIEYLQRWTISRLINKLCGSLGVNWLPLSNFLFN